MNKPANIDAYINDFPEEIRQRLQDIRSTVKTIVPDAGEAIKYGMPTFVWKGNLVHFAAFKNHIGFYPAPADPAGFEIDLSAYKTGKGSIQFPHNQALPLHIIIAITKWRVKKMITA
ncbi:hypothetical protein DSL64_06610 [Dyadobacter luteus]|jgi:uncharacterized protein YdhG (YjbR/CyaY superfamily)|uniref:YdhG-like domain-containing protein n=1 Tax=Dyadobacter luteus TaxID=2259619 RepID=A0A3D8YFC6_9BACT|nr:DUF1801 domain-containing protein [Dyadobacter luteus]REA63282.1 hypothetical protein DSL64_06610 [Dyadobacter luteus]